jgi:abortive infection bacteriophage resistance protein
MVTTYTKLSTSIEDQIALLQQRGLIINNTVDVSQFLQHIGYYRLAGYWQIFQNDLVSHSFIPGTTLEQIMELYNFDRELRFLLLDAIERIEVSFRSVMVNEMSGNYGPTWFSDPALVFSGETLNATIETINHELDRSKEDFVKHHDRKYGKAQHPPAWKTMQVLTLGTLSRIYGNIHKDVPEKRRIAKIYKLPAAAWVQSWMQVVSALRNFCAHHSRVCYRVFNFPPKEMCDPKLPWIKNIPPVADQLNQHLYYQLCIVRYLLQTANPDNNFNAQLKRLIARYPGIDLNRMGFVPGWETEDLWQITSSPASTYAIPEKASLPNLHLIHGTTSFSLPDGSVQSTHYDKA